LPAADRTVLVLGIGATLGVESFVWLTDIARVRREDPVATCQTSPFSIANRAAAARPVMPTFS
jgi:hypothetical protein